MSDALSDLLDEVGNEAFGGLWITVRGRVRAWMDANPVAVHRWRHRLRVAVEEGRL